MGGGEVGGGRVCSGKNTDGAGWEVCDGGGGGGPEGMEEKGCRDGGVIRHVRKVWCVGPSRSPLCLAAECVRFVCEWV